MAVRAGRRARDRATPLRRPEPAARKPPAPARAAPEQVIRTGVELITTDAIVRDGRGQFIADLKKDEFEIFEDGVKQELVSFTLTHGGRVYNVAQPPPPPPQEGIILPPARPTNDAAGRIFLIFVDDLHLDFRNTGRIRDLFKKISKELIHEGDMFGIVSTGPSSICDRSDLRPQASRPGDHEDHRLGPGAEGHPRRSRRRRRVRPKSAIARTSRSRPRTTSSTTCRRCTTGARRSSTSATATTSIRSRRRAQKQEQENVRHAAASSIHRRRQRHRQQLRRTADPFKTQGNKFYQADLVIELS